MIEELEHGMTEITRPLMPEEVKVSKEATTSAFALSAAFNPASLGLDDLDDFGCGSQDDDRDRQEEFVFDKATLKKMARHLTKA